MLTKKKLLFIPITKKTGIDFHCVRAVFVLSLIKCNYTRMKTLTPRGEGEKISEFRSLF